MIILWTERKSLKDWLLPVVMSIVSSLTYIGLRTILGVHAAHGPSSLWAVGRTFLLYLSWMILPLKMSIERSTSAPPNSLSVLSIFAGAVLFLYLGIAYVLRRRAKQLALGMLWIAVTLIPYCGLVFIYQGMAERYEYLASMGLALILGVIVERGTRDARVARLSGVFLTVWMVWGIWRLELRLGDWSDPISLYESSLNATPNSKTLPIDLASTFISMGVESQKSGDLDGAEKSFRKAILYSPNEIAAYNDLGVLLFRRGQRQEGVQLLQKAISLKPLDPDPYFNLAFLYQEIGRTDLAIPL
jgi:tetratricopeptide (TPR) repeat protein